MFMDNKSLVLMAAKACDDKKAKDIKLIKIDKVSFISEWILIAEGLSDVQVRSITNSVEGELREKAKVEPIRKEGVNEAKWALLDYGDLIVNTTPVGMKTAKNEMNLLPYGDYFWRSLNSKTIVYDLIYNPAPTHLLKFSANKGCITIDGLQMLIAQGLKSLSFWTDGLEVPFHVMNDALKNYL